MRKLCLKGNCTKIFLSISSLIFFLLNITFEKTFFVCFFFLTYFFSLIFLSLFLSLPTSLDIFISNSDLKKKQHFEVNDKIFSLSIVVVISAS